LGPLIKGVSTRPFNWGPQKKTNRPLNIYPDPKGNFPLNKNKGKKSHQIFLGKKNFGPPNGKGSYPFKNQLATKKDFFQTKILD